jgi:predicted nucleic acid-binding protein
MASRSGASDQSVASFALAPSCGSLVTRNLAEFSRIPGLRLENWEQA